MTPTFQAEGVRLYLGDAAEIVPALPEVDLLATDPPWGDAYQSSWRADSVAIIHGDRGEVDVPAILQACVRRLRKRRHGYVFGPPELLAGVEWISPLTELIWDKGTMGMGDVSSPWGPAHEPISFFVTSDRARGDARGGGVARLRQSSVLRGLRPTRGCGRRHPNEKSVEVMRRIVEASSNLGETVLDPFMGSASTVVAALLSGRQAIGIEIDPVYFGLAVQRIERMLPTLRLLESA